MLGIAPLVQLNDGVLTVLGANNGEITIRPAAKKDEHAKIIARVQRGGSVCGANWPPVPEGHRIQVRLEAYNALNRTNLGIPVTMIHATTDYDSDLATALFLSSNGAPIPQQFYENMGRAAVQLLVSETDVDAIRRKPAVDDDLRGRMKVQGQPGFAAMSPDVPVPLLGGITADYTAIMWWADAMAGAAERLSAIRKWFQQRASVPLDDPEFQKLRQDLAAHLMDVAAKTSEQFGEPWGLVAMDETSHRRAGASLLITGPRLIRSKQRILPKAVVA